MSYKSILKVIPRFLEREVREKANKLIMFNNFKTDKRFINNFLELLREQIKTYRYLKYCCYVIKKEVKNTEEETKELKKTGNITLKTYNRHMNFFANLEIYLEGLRYDSKKKIGIIKIQMKYLKQNPSLRIRNKLWDMEKSVEFDYRGVLRDVLEFTKEEEVEITKIDVIRFKLSKPIRGFQQLLIGSKSHVTYLALWAISEGLNIARLMNPQHFGDISIFKGLVDAPKDMALIARQMPK